MLLRANHSLRAIANKRVKNIGVRCGGVGSIDATLLRHPATHCPVTALAFVSYPQQHWMAPEVANFGRSLRYAPLDGTPPTSKLVELSNKDPRPKGRGIAEQQAKADAASGGE
jgi:hypothetical protein